MKNKVDIKYLIIYIIQAVGILLLIFTMYNYEKEVDKLKIENEKLKDEAYGYEERLKLYAQDTEDMRKFCDSIWWESYYHHVSSYQEGHAPEEYEYYE